MWNARRPQFSVVATVDDGVKQEMLMLTLVEAHEAVLAKYVNVRSVRDGSAGFTESRQGLSEISQKILEVG